MVQTLPKRPTQRESMVQACTCMPIPSQKGKQRTSSQVNKTSNVSVCKLENDLNMQTQPWGGGCPYTTHDTRLQPHAAPRAAAAAALQQLNCNSTPSALLTWGVQKVIPAPTPVKSSAGCRAKHTSLLGCRGKGSTAMLFKGTACCTGAHSWYPCQSVRL
jgi:hypothetical protein